MAFWAWTWTQTMHARKGGFEVSCMWLQLLSFWGSNPSAWTKGLVRDQLHAWHESAHSCCLVATNVAIVCVSRLYPWICWSFELYARTLTLQTCLLFTRRLGTPWTWAVYHSILTGVDFSQILEEQIHFFFWGGQNVLKADKCMGVTQMLRGGARPGCPPSLRLWVYWVDVDILKGYRNIELYYI